MIFLTFVCCHTQTLKKKDTMIGFAIEKTINEGGEESFWGLWLCFSFSWDIKCTEEAKELVDN